MRLMHIRNGSFSLVERIGQDIPPYAILSHTWGEDEEEVTYYDLLHGKGQDKAGYRKLQFCMQQAQKDALEYFWIDTCCIDKSSSSELTEAINSMFRWYQHSKKCYVYLSDVVLGTVTGARSLPLDVVHQSLSESRWFSRGWTLQELIAPKTVQFFSFERRLIGTKNSLETIIHEITGINEEVLRGKPLSQVSIQDRLSWANERKTKRDEDESYALMGLFALLSQLTAWAEDIHSKPIFWLNGMAGTGKSTIARTLASAFADQGHLGASFFFNSSEAQLNNARLLFTTIAAGLAESVPKMIPVMRDAQKRDPLIADRPLKIQFEQLILSPLRSVKSVSEVNFLKIIIVIDALDECGQDDDIREILRLLPLVKKLRTVSLRVFLTSRPELPIRFEFRKMSHVEYDNMILHEIPASVVQSDIEVFLRHELALVRGQRTLPADWPTADQIQKLAELASPLFIFAATACRYIGDTKHNPQRRLELMLHQMEAQNSKLDGTYLPLMHLLFEEEDEADKEYWVSEFRTIVGSVVLLVDPLSVNALSELIGKSKFDIGCRLDSLHSVLNVPEENDSPFRLLHLSFRDCLLDPKKQGKSPLWIDEYKTHEELAVHCINLISSPPGLQAKPRNVLQPGEWLGNEVMGSSPGKDFSLAFEYACRYWTEHLVMSKVMIHETSSVYTFIQMHFLHWLELIRILDRRKHRTVLEDLQMKCTVTGSPVHKFLKCAIRLLSNSDRFINDLPLQLQNPALPYPLADCIIRNKFESYIAGWPERASSKRGTPSQVCESKITSDGHLFAYVTSDVLSIWNLATGRCICSYRGPWAALPIIEWAPNALFLACVRYDGAIRLVDSSTAETLELLRVHSLPINCLQFCTRGKLLLSASDDGAICVWNTSNGLWRAKLLGNRGAIKHAVFSTDSRMIASGCANGTVCIWNTETATCRTELTGHSDVVTSVTFSENNQLVASCSRDKTVKIWQLETSSCLRTIVHDSHPTVATFGGGNQVLATAAVDSTIQFWGIRQGFYLCFAHRGVYAPQWCIKSLSFSDGLHLETDHGRFHLRSSGAGLQDHKQHTLFATPEWVVHRGQPVLRIPDGLEPLCSTRHGNTICLGHRFGSWTLLRFDDDGTLTKLISTRATAEECGYFDDATLNWANWRV